MARREYFTVNAWASMRDPLDQLRRMIARNRSIDPKKVSMAEALHFAVISTVKECRRKRAEIRREAQ